MNRNILIAIAAVAVVLGAVFYFWPSGAGNVQDAIDEATQAVTGDDVPALDDGQFDQVLDMIRQGIPEGTTPESARMVVDGMIQSGVVPAGVTADQVMEALGF